MSTNMVIIIVPNSQRTVTLDVHKLSTLIETVVAKAGPKLRADFKVDVVSDFNFATGMGDGCDHEVILMTKNGKMIAMEGKRYEDAKAKCLKCGTDFKLIRDRATLAKAVELENANTPGG